MSLVMNLLRRKSHKSHITYKNFYLSYVQERLDKPSLFSSNIVTKTYLMFEESNLYPKTKQSCGTRDDNK